MYEIEDESSKPTDEDSVKMVKKKGSTSKCSYCSNGFHPDKKCSKKNMDIMLLEFEYHLDIQTYSSNNVCSKQMENEDTN